MYFSSVEEGEDLEVLFRMSDEGTHTIDLIRVKHEFRTVRLLLSSLYTSLQYHKQPVNNYIHGHHT